MLFSSKKKWLKIKEKVKDIKDFLGKPIDKKIEKTVIILNYLGINTSSSCEGHLSHGTFAPYIDIESYKAQKLEDKLKKYKFESTEWKKIEKKIRHLNLIEQQKIIYYLKKFYQKKKGDYYCQLIIRPWGHSIARLESLGSSLQECLPRKERKENLLKFQKEMARFTRFLEDNFLKE